MYIKRREEIARKYHDEFNKIWHPELSVILNCEIGNDCIIHAQVWIGDKVKIGDRTKVQAQCFIPEGVEIGNDCFIGPGVVFTNDKAMGSGRENWLKTIVRDKVKIGANSTILPGIEIGEGAVIGAGSVITKDIPANETWVGNPAKKL